MANHLTPDELAAEYGVEVDEVLEIIRDEHIPIYSEGRVCRGLFEPHLKQRLLTPA